MSLRHNPAIVTNGLIFYYDMNNTKKSWLGAPSTNIFTYSSSLSNWNKSGGINTIIDNAAVAPDGSMSASLVTANGSTNSYIYSGGGVSTGVTYTKSIYAKAVSTNILVFETYDNNGAGGAGYYSTTFDLSAGTVSSTAAGDTASIVNLGNGWYRCITTRAITLSNSLSGTFYIGAYGSGTGAVYLWRPQLEIGSFATPQILTGAASASRSNTQAIVDLTGQNTLTAASLTYASDGTFSFNGSNNYIDISNSTLISGNNPYTISAWFNSFTSSGLAIFGNYGSSYTANTIWVFGGGLYFSGSYYITNYSSRIAGKHNICVTRDSNGSIQVYFDGILEVSASNTNAVSTNQNYRIGADVNGAGEPFNGNIYVVQVYNRSLSASEVSQNFNALRGRYGI